MEMVANGGLTFGLFLGTFLLGLALSDALWKGKYQYDWGGRLSKRISIEENSRVVRLGIIIVAIHVGCTLA